MGPLIVIESDRGGGVASASVEPARPSPTTTCRSSAAPPNISDHVLATGDARR